MARTASTIEGVNFSARAPFNFVEREVRATERSSSRSISLWILNLSRNYKKLLEFALDKSAN